MKQLQAVKKLFVSMVLGTPLAFAVLTVVSATMLNPPQCPDEYTQQQIDASSCIVGANIGGPLLLLMLAPLIWIGSIALVYVLLGRYTKTFARKPAAQPELTKQG